MEMTLVRASVRSCVSNICCGLLSDHVDGILVLCHLQSLYSQFLLNLFLDVLKEIYKCPFYDTKICACASGFLILPF